MFLALSYSRLSIFAAGKFDLEIFQILNTPSYRALKLINWLRAHRAVVLFFVLVLEVAVYLLDQPISSDVPVAQFHWFSIILASVVYEVPGAILAALSATSLFYLANFVNKGRIIDWDIGPSLLITLLIFLLVGAGTITITRLLGYLEKSNRDLADKLQQLQASAAKIELLTAERERSRLARELHDGVVKTLFGIEYAAGALTKLIASSPSPAPLALEQSRFIQEVSRQEGQAVRDIILDLRQGYDEPLFTIASRQFVR